MEAFLIKATNEIKNASDIDVEVSLGTYTQKVIQDLSQSDREILDRLTLRQQEDWVLSKLTLGQFLEDKNQPPHKSKIPHNISFARSKLWALAMKTKNSVRGLGIDMELNSDPQLEGARFILTDKEWRWLEGSTHAKESFLRLWTIKKAIKKSDPTSHARSLLDYELLDFDLNKGKAICLVDESLKFHYLCSSEQKNALSLVLLK